MQNVPFESSVSHRDIIGRANGPAAVARKISDIAEKSSRPPVDANTTKAWARTDSIPAAYWQDFADAGLCTLEELAAAAAAKRNAAAEKRTLKLVA